MFPIIIHDGKAELPDTGTYYVVSGDGLFIHKDTGLVKGFVPVDKISFLEPLQQRVRLLLPKLDAETLAPTVLFFRQVCKKHHSEAAVLLHYNSQTEEYMIHCPEQEVSSGHVKYQADERFGDGAFQLVGTIHSHNGFGAFHSGVDINDEQNFDGLHVTIGNLDQPYFTISCTVAINGQRTRIDPESVINGIRQVDFQPASPFRYRRRDIQHFDKNDEETIENSDTPQPKSLLGMAGDALFDALFPDVPLFGERTSYYSGSTQAPGYVMTPPKAQYWDLVLPDGMDYRHTPAPPSWMEQVKKPFRFGFGLTRNTEKDEDGDEKEDQVKVVTAASKVTASRTRGTLP